MTVNQSTDGGLYGAALPQKDTNASRSSLLKNENGFNIPGHGSQPVAGVLPPLNRIGLTREDMLVMTAKSIKGRQGRRGLPEAVTAAMYQDYLGLHSLSAVGRKYGRTRQSVYCLFHTHGLKLDARNFGKRIEHAGRVFTPAKDGYYRATTGDRIALHHLLWLEAGHAIPAGWQVSFKDGDHENFALENLFCDSLIGVTLFHQRRLGKRKYFTPEALRKRKAEIQRNCYQRKKVEFLAKGLTTTGKVRQRHENFIFGPEANMAWRREEMENARLQNTRQHVLENYYRRKEKFAASGLNTRGQKRSYHLRGKSALFKAYEQLREEALPAQEKIYE